MKHSARLAAVALGVLGVLGAGLGTAPSVASPGGWEEQHFEWGETVEDFCDVQGLTVEDVGSGDSRSRTVVRGGMQYDEGRSVDTDVYTNLATGRSVTNVQVRNERDLAVTDNGDGTLTVIYHATATNTAYDDQGNVIARDAGSVTVESVWDHQGTVQDRGDDEPLSFTFLRSTGHRYDFCGVLVPALT
jgi:hypothetical protein